MPLGVEEHVADSEFPHTRGNLVDLSAQLQRKKKPLRKNQLCFKGIRAEAAPGPRGGCWSQMLVPGAGDIGMELRRNYMFGFLQVL